jgi:hypothetical protein
MRIDDVTRLKRNNMPFYIKKPLRKRSGFSISYYFQKDINYLLASIAKLAHLQAQLPMLFERNLLL